jgi:hypothetical protein
MTKKTNEEKENVSADKLSGIAPGAENEFFELDALIEAEKENDVDSDYNPEKEEKDNKEAEAAAIGQSMVAVAVIGQIMNVVKPEIKITADQKKQVQEKLYPVLLKYSTGGVPPWLLKYREEMELLAALGMIGFSVFQQVKAQEAANDTTGGNDGEQSESEAS